MPEHRTEVILHGGFHKTATTHIQGILKRNSGYLERHGTRYVHHRQTRKEFTVPVQLNGYFMLDRPHRDKIDTPTMQRQTKSFFKKVGKGARERLLMSDENMAGHCGQCVRHATLYPFRREFVGTFAREIPYRVAEVHLAIRHTADFFASAYIEFLRSMTAKVPFRRFVDEPVLRRQVLENMPSWYDAVSDIRACVPSAKIVVWRYEDYKVNANRIMQNLCGPDVQIDRLKIPKNQKTRPSASSEAMGRMLEIVRNEGIAQMVNQRVDIQNRYRRDQGWGRYDPWTLEERTALTRAYDDDWHRICDDATLTVLDPEKTST